MRADIVLSAPVHCSSNMESVSLQDPLSKVSFSDHLLRYIRNVTTEDKNRPCITDVCSGDAISYGDLDEMSWTVGSALTKRGFRGQDVFMYVTFNSCRIYPVLFGVWRLNGIIHPSYPEDREETLFKRMMDSCCRFIVCDKTFSPTVLSACAKLDWPVQVFCFDRDVEGCDHVDVLFNDDGTAFPESVRVNDDDTVALVCTGGTTGVSKCAVHTHATFKFVMESNAYLVPDVKSKTIAIPGKIFHLLGILTMTFGTLYGCHTLTMSKPDPLLLIRGIDKYKPSFLFCFPTFVMWLITHPESKKYDLTSVKTIVSGGASYTKAMEEQILAALPHLLAFHNGYGATETLHISNTLNLVASTAALECPKYEDTPDLSVGRPVPSVHVKVVDPETGETLGANESGEIWVSSPMVMKGYYKNPQATRETLKDGWCNTGDYGYIDRNGFIFCVDRLKEVFKYWNNHVSPIELENVLAQHPAVAECCVIGIPDKDGGGCVPRAYVVKKEGSNVDADTVIKYFDERVASYQQMRGGLEFIDQLPKSQAGKMSRRALHDLYLSQNN